MEVSGRRSSDDKTFSLSKGSADDFEFSCQPCANEGHSVEVAGFCQNCQEYLCVTCYKWHCKPTPTRHHVLLDKNNMPSKRAPTSNKHECTLSVKSVHDGHDCWITGIVFIAPDTLVCTDCDNNSVKLIDIKVDTITSELKLTAGPWDTTYVSYDQLAVTETNEWKIHFLSFRSGLSKTRSIDVEGYCCGIAYSKDRLVVSFIGPGKVEILSLGGEVIQRVDTDSSGKAIYQFPRYVAVDGDGNCIYVSDWENNSVTKITISEKVLPVTYKDENLKWPEGISVCSDGSVLVCNSGNNNLHLMSSECKKIKTMLLETERPQALCFNNETGLLFLSSAGAKKDKILKYKFA